MAKIGTFTSCMTFGAALQPGPMRPPAAQSLPAATSAGYAPAVTGMSACIAGNTFADCIHPQFAMTHWMQTKGFRGGRGVHGWPFLSLPPTIFQQEMEFALPMMDGRPPWREDIFPLKSALSGALSQGLNVLSNVEVSPEPSAELITGIRNALWFLDRTQGLKQGIRKKKCERIAEDIGAAFGEIHDERFFEALRKLWDPALSSSLYRHSRAEPLNARIALAIAERTATTQAIVADVDTPERFTELLTHLLFFQSHRLDELADPLRVRATALVGVSGDPEELLRPLHLMMGTVQPDWSQLENERPADILIALLALFRTSKEQIIETIDRAIGVPRFLALFDGRNIVKLGFPPSNFSTLKGLPIESLPVEHQQTLARGILLLISLMRDRMALVKPGDQRMHQAIRSVTERLTAVLDQRILRGGIGNARAKAWWLREGESDSFLRACTAEEFALLVELAPDEMRHILIAADNACKRNRFETDRWQAFLRIATESGFLRTLVRRFEEGRLREVLKDSDDLDALLMFDNEGEVPKAPLRRFGGMEWEILYRLFAKCGPQVIAWYDTHPDHLRPQDLVLLTELMDESFRRVNEDSRE